MKNKQSLFILTFSIICIATKLSAQDPAFSQFYANPMYTNPAFAGSDCGRIAMAYRIQYYGLPGGFVTFNASYDQRVDKIGGGFGFMFTNDKAGEGILTANHINLAYAYEIEVSKKINVRIGIQGGIFQKSLQWDRLRWGDQIIAQLGFVNPTNETRVDKTVTAANFATGVLVYSNKFYAGFACHNITEPNQSFFGSTGPGTTLPQRFTLHGGMVIPIGGNESDLKISPNVLMMSQAKFNQVNVGCYMSKAEFVTGVWYRQSNNPDAVIFMIGFRPGKFKFGYSIDITISQLQSAGKTAHEITAIYQFNKKKEPCSRDPRCPTY